MTSNFRINSKNLFLTYAQCPLEPERILARIQELERPAVIQEASFIRVVQETHEDGNFHLHALICLPRRGNFRDEAAFDVDGYHPNIQAARSIRDIHAYMSKEVILEAEYGELPYENSNSSERLMEEVTTCRSIQDVRNVMIRYQKISQCSFWIAWWQGRQVEEQAVAAVRPLSTFTVCPAIRRWMTDHGNKSLVLVGAAGIGKTELARALAAELGEYFWCPHREGMRHFRGESCIVFDDVDFAKCSRNTILNYIDVEQLREFRVLYGTITIGAGTRRILTTNAMELLFGEWADAPEVRRRIEVITIAGGLY